MSFFLKGKDKNFEVSLTPQKSYVKINGMELPCREINLKAVAGEGTYITVGLFPSALELIAEASEIELVDKSEVEDERLKAWRETLFEAKALSNRRKNGRLKGKDFSQVAAPMIEALSKIMGETESSTDEKIYGVSFEATVLYHRLDAQLELEMSQ